MEQVITPSSPKIYHILYMQEFDVQYRHSICTTQQHWCIPLVINYPQQQVNTNGSLIQIFEPKNSRQKLWMEQTTDK